MTKTTNHAKPRLTLIKSTNPIKERPTTTGKTDRTASEIIWFVFAVSSMVTIFGAGIQLMVFEDRSIDTCALLFASMMIATLCSVAAPFALYPKKGTD